MNQNKRRFLLISTFEPFLTNLHPQVRFLQLSQQKALLQNILEVNPPPPLNPLQNV